jgi:hypothetical protein
VLDDNRLYRKTDPPIPPPKPAKPKANSKKARAAARAAKRRKLSESTAVKDEEDSKEDANGDVAEQDAFGGYKWECIAITVAQYQEFVNSIHKTKDPNEQILRDRLVDHVLPVIEKAEEAQQKKILRREKELINLQRLATAKRSSRIASRHERERQEIEAAEEARQRETERTAVLKEQEKQKMIERERLYRMMTREQRLKDREQRRIQHEEELARMTEEAKKAENGEARISERQLKAEMEKRKRDLEALQDEDQWIFDCSICGTHGENLVSTPKYFPSQRTLFSKRLIRTTAPTALLARNAMSGNTVNALAFRKRKPRRMTSISSVLIVSDGLKMRNDRRFLL